MLAFVVCCQKQLSGLLFHFCGEAVAIPLPALIRDTIGPSLKVTSGHLRLRLTTKSLRSWRRHWQVGFTRLESCTSSSATRASFYKSAPEPEEKLINCMPKAALCGRGCLNKVCIQAACPCKRSISHSDPIRLPLPLKATSIFLLPSFAKTFSKRSPLQRFVNAANFRCCGHLCSKPRGNLLIHPNFTERQQTQFSF